MNNSWEFLAKIVATLVISPFLIWLLGQPDHSVFLSIPLCALNGYFVSKGVFE